MPHFQIKSRWTDGVLFEGNFDTMALCAGAAVKARANLAGANLAGANLAGANLAGANLASANLASANLAGADFAGTRWDNGYTLRRAPVRIATRSDGYTFYLLDTEEGGWRISAGCRFFTPDEAWAHWERTRPEDDANSLGAETRDILTMFELAMGREAR